MTTSKIKQEISKLEGSIADVERQKAAAERNICQLEALEACCREYQTEFEYAGNVRRSRLGNFIEIEGQDRLVGAYAMMLRELLNGREYIRAYGDMETARAEIRREIERQKEVVNDCISQIAGLSGSLSVWRQQYTNVDKETRNAG